MKINRCNWHYDLHLSLWKQERKIPYKRCLFLHLEEKNSYHQRWGSKRREESLQTNLVKNNPHLPLVSPYILDTFPHYFTLFNLVCKHLSLTAFRVLIFQWRLTTMYIWKLNLYAFQSLLVWLLLIYVRSRWRPLMDREKVLPALHKEVSSFWSTDLESQNEKALIFVGSTLQAENAPTDENRWGGKSSKFLNLISFNYLNCTTQVPILIPCLWSKHSNSNLVSYGFQRNKSQSKFFIIVLSMAKLNCNWIFNNFFTDTVHH